MSEQADERSRPEEALDLRAFLDVFHEQAEIGELGRPPERLAAIFPQ
jgi:hypothetical protein